MNQTSETLTRLSKVNKAFIKPLPNSTKIFVEGSHPDIQVPMREIKLTDTIGDLAEVNEPIHIYDTSGPYTDPSRSEEHRLNSSHALISYAVFCLKKKKTNNNKNNNTNNNLL